MKYPNHALEKKFFSRGFKYIIGCDEAGRGSLAGPVVAAAVVFDSAVLKKSLWQKGIKDSKLLSPKVRKKLFAEIKKQALAWSLGLAQLEEIERVNIHRAVLRAMRRALSGLGRNFLQAQSLALIDGKFILPELALKQEPIVDGDYKVFCIAAASIVAKVHRDKLMMKLRKKFPAYDFAQNKGYGTRFHIQQIKKYGLSPAHRPSFCDHLI